MAADREVIREYLVSLGFSLDQQGAKKFAEALGFTNRRALAVTGAIAGITVAAEEMVRSFARSMTNLYYASQRTKTPVAQLQAFKFAAEQVGVSGDDALATIEALSAELRKNPGKQALLDTLGVAAKGVSNLERMHSLVQGLNQKFPYFVAQQFAEQFGIPEHVFFQLTNNYDELIKKEKEHQALLKSLGIDSEAAAVAARKYQQEIGELGLRFDVLKQKASAAMLPAFKGAVENMTRTMDMMTNRGGLSWLAEDKGRHLPGFILEQLGIDALPDGAAPTKRPGVAETPSGAVTGPAMKRRDRSARDGSAAVADVKRSWGSLTEWWSSRAAIDNRSYAEAMKDDAGATPAAAAAAPNSSDIRAAAARIAEEFGIPQSIFASMIKTESAWNARAVSQKGAMGLTQLLPGTAKDMGVTDAFDPMQNLRGGAGYLKQQFERFGDWRKALAAYNYGPNRDFSPAYATYADPILRAAAASEQQQGSGGGNITLHQKTDIHITGGDPVATGRAVASEMGRVNADIVRSFATVPR